MESRLANGEQIDIQEHATLSSTLVRLAQRIGIDRVLRDVTPSLADIAEERSNVRRPCRLPMPMVDDQWKRLLLIERICELDALARECGDPEIAKTVLRARLCLEDSELGMAERFCIYAELAITGQKRVCSEIVS